MTRGRGAAPRALQLALAGVVIATLAPSADAALPGRNGQIAYSQRVSSSSGTGPRSGNYGHIFVRWPGQRARALWDGPTWEDVTGPAFSPSGRRLAVGVSTSRGGGIYTARRLRPARWRRLTRAPGEATWDINPEWSRDGQLVFERLRLDPEDRAQASIRLYRRDGSRRIAAGRDPAWSVRGSIAFVRAEGVNDSNCRIYDIGRGNCGGHGVYVMRSNGSRLRRLAAGIDPDWSPDGRWVVFSTPAGDLALVRPSGRGLRLITRSGRKDHRWPAFSPDGRKIAFVSGPAPHPDEDIAVGPPSQPYTAWESGPSRLYVIALRSGRLRRIARSSGGWIEAPDWQPLRRGGG